MAEYDEGPGATLDERRTAYKEGFDAFANGETLGNCPYGNLLWSRKSGHLMHAWTEGFRFCRDTSSPKEKSNGA